MRELAREVTFRAASKSELPTPASKGNQELRKAMLLGWQGIFITPAPHSPSSLWPSARRKGLTFGCQLLVQAVQRVADQPLCLAQHLGVCCQPQQLRRLPAVGPWGPGRHRGQWRIPSPLLLLLLPLRLQAAELGLCSRRGGSTLRRCWVLRRGPGLDGPLPQVH